MFPPLPSRFQNSGFRGIGRDMPNSPLMNHRNSLKTRVKRKSAVVPCPTCPPAARATPTRNRGDRTGAPRSAHRRHAKTDPALATLSAGLLAEGLPGARAPAGVGAHGAAPFPSPGAPGGSGSFETPAGLTGPERSCAAHPAQVGAQGRVPRPPSSAGGSRSRIATRPSPAGAATSASPPL